MKVGDRLKCKRKSHGLVLDKEYSIIGIVDNTTIQVKLDNDLKNNILTRTAFFDITKMRQRDAYIWDYFFTPQEIRKFKLEKLYR